METPEKRDEILVQFKRGPEILENALKGITEEELDYIPLNGGWTVREIIHHLADGDDLWKIGIKMALGNNNAEIKLDWYSAYPQREWGKKWAYEKRSIDASLSFFKSVRTHMLQIIESVDDCWDKSVRFVKPDGETETVPVGFIIQMQGNHAVHHVNRILEIRKEYASV